MPSRESSLANLEKARANWRQPKPWRSKQETYIIKRLVWQWSNYQGREKWSGRAVGRRLGVSHTYIQKLTREFMTAHARMRRWEETYGEATFEDLRLAKECTQRQRISGNIRYPFLYASRFPKRTDDLGLTPTANTQFQRDGVMDRVMNRIRQREREEDVARRSVGITGY